MTAKIKLNAASGGGSISIQAPSSSSNNRVISLPDIADGTILTSQSSLDSTKLSPAIAAGITMADQWRINTEFTFDSSGAVITSNWERVDTDGFGQLGTGMTESSGVFSFPSTGIYFIDFFGTGRRNSGNDRYGQIDLQTTTDNSNYSQAATFYVIAPSAYNRSTGSLRFIFDVTNVSTHKFRFFEYEAWGTLIFQGSTQASYNALTILRLGDT